MNVLLDVNTAHPGTVEFVDLKSLDPNNLNYLHYDMFVVVAHGAMGVDGMPEVDPLSKCKKKKANCVAGDLDPQCHELKRAGCGRLDWKLRRLWGVLTKQSARPNVLIVYMPCNHDPRLIQMVDQAIPRLTQDAFMKAKPVVWKRTLKEAIEKFKKNYVPKVRTAWVVPAKQFTTKPTGNVFLVYKTHGALVVSTVDHSNRGDDDFFLKAAIDQFLGHGLNNAVLAHFRLQATKPFTIEQFYVRNEGMLGFQFRDITAKDLMTKLATICNKGLFNDVEKNGVKLAAGYLPYGDQLTMKLETFTTCDSLTVLEGDHCKLKARKWEVECKQPVAGAGLPGLPKPFEPVAAAAAEPKRASCQDKDGTNCQDCVIHKGLGDCVWFHATKKCGVEQVDTSRASFKRRVFECDPEHFDAIKTAANMFDAADNKGAVQKFREVRRIERRLRRDLRALDAILP